MDKYELAVDTGSCMVTITKRKTSPYHDTGEPFRFRVEDIPELQKLLEKASWLAHGCGTKKAGGGN